MPPFVTLPVGTASYPRRLALSFRKVSATLSVGMSDVLRGELAAGIRMRARTNCVYILMFNVELYEMCQLDYTCRVGKA